MKKILLYFSSMFLACACMHSTYAQSHLIDSLQNDLKNSRDDSARIYLYTALANEFYSYDTSKSAQYLDMAYMAAKKLNWDYALGDYYQVKGIRTQFSSNNVLANIFFDSAIYYFKQNINSTRPAPERENAKLSLATSLGEKANILVKSGRSEDAIVVYLDVLEAWRSSNDPRKNEAIGIYYGKISGLYFGLKQYEKALSYDKLSITTFMLANNVEQLAWAYMYVCNDFIPMNLIDSAILYLNKAKPIVEQLNNHRLNGQYFNKLAQISSQKKDYRTAILYYEKTVEEAKIMNDKYRIMLNQRMIGTSYVRLGEYANARKYLLMVLPVANTEKYTKEKIAILQELVTVEEKSNNPAEALNYLEEMVALKDSVNLENSQTAVAEIENKYQAAEKEKEIIKLNSDKQLQALSIKQKSTLNYFLFGSIVALLLVGFLIYRNLRHRHQLTKQQDELHQQRISELEKDKQLDAVDLMLQGQEEERGRLAKDLHDGLGGLLSGVKFSLSNMKDNLIITPDSMAVFERSLDMIDTSIKELRRVAHNLMPEMLTRFGLDEALKEYCGTINTTKLLSVKYVSMGMENRPDKTVEIIVYRIIQELINNVMKHASAKEAIVQLIREDSRLNIIVEDDGNGFDTNLLENSKGAGLMSIRSRVEYLKGQLDIHSEPGKGTLINIEINL